MVAEMTRDELQQLVTQTVRQTLYQVLRDPDQGLALQDWVVERLKQAKPLDKDALIPAGQVAAELGLNW